MTRSSGGGGEFLDWLFFFGFISPRAGREEEARLLDRTATTDAKTVPVSEAFRLTGTELCKICSRTAATNVCFA
jgi:hypothetical protein